MIGRLSAALKRRRDRKLRERRVANALADFVLLDAELRGRREPGGHQ